MSVVAAHAGSLSLPMYNVTPGVAALWRRLLEAFAERLRAHGWGDGLRIVDRHDDLMGLWRADDLVLSQTCGYPLVTELGTAVQVLAAAEFDVPGCEGHHYRSTIVVPEHGATSLEQLRGGVAAINQWHSHSGMNALRHCVAPLAREGRFFSRIEVSGGHMASMAAVQSGRADVAAIDCVTYALARRYAPAATAGLRVLQFSASAPGLPLICAATLTAQQVEVLRTCLQELPAHAALCMAQLNLRRFVPLSMADYRPIGAMHDEARARAYPELA